MKHLTQLTLTALTALSLTACGAEPSGEMGQSNVDHSAIENTGNASDTMDHSQMDHANMNQGEMMGDTGHTTGVIMSISPDGSEATINHQAIEGVGMDAMTMGFAITSTVDLSGYAKDDSVSFMVKKGRDNSYRITAICNTATDGTDCLNSLMDHSKAPTDYKAMFGPDYQRGDIGHSIGVVESNGMSASSITIAHGMIHGIDRQASTTTFPIPDNVALEDIAEGARVEFLVKKEGDNAYSLFKICEIQGSSEKCL